MAQVGMWLQGAKGRVGGSTLYSSGGKTIIRETRSTAKDAKTFAQCIQRVIAKTAMNQYSALQEIANHSFQGKAAGQQCMSRFLSRNMSYFRERAAEIQQQGGSIYNFYQFAAVGSLKYTPAAVILSEGKLPRVITYIITNGQYAYFNGVSGTSYQAVANAIGAKRGDQVTFVTVEKDYVTGDYVPHFARIILDPRNTDGTPAPFTSNFVTDNEVQFPNMRNQGAFSTLLTQSPGELHFNLSGGLVVAAGVIISRKVRGVWSRSSCKLVLNETLLGVDAMSLGYAVDTSLTGSEIYTDNDLYLNNAGNGGPQGTAEVVAGGDGAVYSNDVVINGVMQNISSGSVTIGDRLTSIVVNGVNIPANALTLTAESGSFEPESFTGSGNSASWSGDIVVNQEGTFVVKRGGNTWFTINMVHIGGLE